MFSKKEKKVTMGTNRTEIDTQTILGENCEFEGIIKADGLRIEGTLKGSIQSARQVIVGSKGQVYGDIHAGDLMVAGHVVGNTYISNRLELGSTGVIDGDIETNVLVLDEGAIFRGTSKMQRTSGQDRLLELDYSSES